MTAADELSTVRIRFHTGAYQATLTAAQALSDGALSPDTVALKHAFVARAHLALDGPDAAMHALATAAVSPEHPTHVATRLLILASSPASRLAASQQAAALAVSADSPADAAAIVALLLFNEGQFDDAMRIVHPHAQAHVECAAVLVQCYLRIFRPDLAATVIAAMKRIGEDDVLTQLAEAWTHIAMGAEKYDLAFYIFQELLETYGSTPKLLVAQAVCRMHTSNFTEAEKLLADALRMDPNNVEALVNLVVSSTITQKSNDLIVRYLTYTTCSLGKCDLDYRQVRQLAPNHPFIEEYDLKASLFDRCVQKFAI